MVATLTHPVDSYSSQGIALGLMAACFWAVSPMCFASAGRRIGSYRVVTLRTLFAGALLWLILPGYAALSGAALTLPDGRQFFWLALSGFLGMALGDALVYEALVIIGPRRSTQVLTLSPVAAILPGWIWLNEALTWHTLLGVALVLAGTSYAVLAGSGRRGLSPFRKREGEALRGSKMGTVPLAASDEDEELNREPGRVSAAGIAFAAGGAICVGLGAFAGRKAFVIGQVPGGHEMDAAVATAVRVSSAAVMLFLVPVAMRRVRHTFAGLRDGHAVRRLALGIAAGPVSGMLCYIFALRDLEGGLVSTLTAMSPLFILPMMAARYRMHVGWKLAGAAALAVAGVAMIRLS